jgi:aryl-alcohol dehydrogenase-like predicted oxidoreductase
VDHLDVYQLHGPPQLFPELFVELDDLRQRGLVRRFGIGAESAGSARSWCASSGVEVLQLPFGVLDPGAATTVFPIVGSRPLDLWIRGVVGGGVLSAAMAQPAAVGAHPKLSRITALAQLATEAGIGLDELAIRWTRQFQAVTAMLAGMSSIAHLQRNLELIALPPLSTDLNQAVSAVIAVGEQAHEST